ncbi:MAG: radical SAM protein, partial [Rhodospirillales bacterium]|nr:radical SAM protein [Rhodospirillales bacterium]
LSMHAALRRNKSNWYESPSHQALSMIGSAAHARQASTRYRRLYIIVAAIQKFRELLHQANNLIEARISSSAARGALLDGLMRWYVYDVKVRNAEFNNNPLHTTIFVSDEDSRLMDLFPMMLSGGLHNNLTFVWRDTNVPYNYRGRHTVHDAPPNDREFDTAYNIGSPNVEAENIAQHEGVTLLTPSIQYEGRRRANDLLKSITPGSLIVAVSLPEDDLGFCDAALRKHLAMFTEIHNAFSYLAFCLVNRTTLDVENATALNRAGLIPVRSRGLNTLAALALIESSDIFIGDMGCFAYVALGKGKPGIYMQPNDGDSHNSERKQWFLVSPQTKQVMDIMTSLSESIMAPNLPRYNSEISLIVDKHKTLNRITSKDTIVAENVIPLPSAGQSADPLVTLSEGWEKRVEKSIWRVEPSKRRKVTLYIDVFGYCNLRCPSCPVGNWPKDEEQAFTSGIMDETTIRQILEKALAEAEISSVGLFNWTEPLLNPNVNHLISVVRSYGLSCSISSNLNILKDPTGLLASGVDWMRISVSGFTQEVYGHYHKQGDIERVKHNMRRLAESRDELDSKTDIEVFFHKYLDNGDDEKKMKAFAESLGFRFVSAWAYLMPVEKMLAIAEPDSKNASGLTDQDRDLISHLALSPEEALSITRVKKTKDCPLYDYLTININGDIFLCCAASGKPQNQIANYLDTSLGDIYKKQLRHSLCGSCLKHGLPELYGHTDPKFEDIGVRARADWEDKNDNILAAVNRQVTPR